MTTRIPAAADHLKAFTFFEQNSPDLTQAEAELRDAAALKKELTDVIHQRAYLAHRQGMTWEQIATLLGITRQKASADFRLPPLSMRT